MAVMHIRGADGHESVLHEGSGKLHFRARATKEVLALVEGERGASRSEKTG